jgi:hypothetical protein
MMSWMPICEALLFFVQASVYSDWDPFWFDIYFQVENWFKKIGQQNISMAYTVFYGDPSVSTLIRESDYIL